MEAANESGRHAARSHPRGAEPHRRLRDDRKVGATTICIKSLKNKTYNGAAEAHTFDFPDIFNVEELELEDLEFFRRVDRRLVSLGLKHFLDIIDFDRKLLHALDAVEIYKGKAAKEFLGSRWRTSTPRSLEPWPGLLRQAGQTVQRREGVPPPARRRHSGSALWRHEKELCA